MSFDIYVNTTDGLKTIEQASPLLRVNMWQFPQSHWGTHYFTLGGYVGSDLLMVDWGGYPGNWWINGALPNVAVALSNGEWGYIRFTAYRRVA